MYMGADRYLRKKKKFKKRQLILLKNCKINVHQNGKYCTINGLSYNKIHPLELHHPDDTLWDSKTYNIDVLLVYRKKKKTLNDSFHIERNSILLISRCDNIKTNKKSQWKRRRKKRNNAFPTTLTQGLSCQNTEKWKNAIEKELKHMKEFKHSKLYQNQIFLKMKKLLTSYRYL